MIYLFLGFFGIILLVFGFLRLYKIILKKEILKVKIGVLPVTVILPRSGIYGVLIRKKNTSFSKCQEEP
jgi:hypothetical protein